MKNERGLQKHEGFTLVELLIVIIIIGILAGAMMLASFAATDKAKATRIAGEISTMKTAALFYYNDEDSWPEWTNTVGSPEKYLEQKPVFEDYWLGVIEESEDSGNRVAVFLMAASLDKAVKTHLTRMAAEMGYYKTTAESIPESASLDGYDGGENDNLICFICPE